MLAAFLLVSTLTAGPFAVGFEQHGGEPAISVWYPAAARGESLQFRRHTGGAETDLRAFLSSTGMSPEAIDLYLATEMIAALDAPRRRGTYSMVLIAHGNGHDVADQAFLAEYLASHGFIVASVPSPMVKTPMTSAEEIAMFAERQADDLAAAMDRLKVKRAVIVGHSFGARSALLLAMRDGRVCGIVSLDGGIGTATGADALRASRSFDASRTPPILHLYADVDPFMKADFAFLDSLGAPFLRKEKISGIRHAQFTSIGFASARIPELARIMKSSPDIAFMLQKIAAETLAFARRYTARHSRSLRGRIPRR